MSKPFVIALFGASTLAGCAGAPSGNQAGITFTDVDRSERGRVIQDAQDHCARFGRDSRLSVSDGDLLSFECVPSTS